MGEGFEDKVFNSVKTAKEKLQPASLAYGTGVAYINVNHRSRARQFLITSNRGSSSL
jgi:hypothetical protein